MVAPNWSVMLQAAMTANALFLPTLEILDEKRSDNSFESSSDTFLVDRSADIDLNVKCSITSATIGNGVIILSAAAAGGFAGYFYGKSQADSCAGESVTVTAGGSDTDANDTDATDATRKIYAHLQPYTTGSNCETTAQKVTIKNGIISGANQLRQAGAHAGCCTLQHGGGTWHAHMKLKTGPEFSFDDISCPAQA